MADLSPFQQYSLDSKNIVNNRYDQALASYANMSPEQVAAAMIDDGTGRYSFGSGDNYDAAAYQKAYNERLAQAQTPEGRAALGKADLDSQKTGMQGQYEFSLTHPGGYDGGDWMDHFMGNVFPAIVGAVFVGAGMGLGGAAAGETGAAASGAAAGEGATSIGAVAGPGTFDYAGLSNVVAGLPEAVGAGASVGEVGAGIGAAAGSGAAGAGGGNVGMFSDLLGLVDDTGLSSFTDAASSAAEDTFANGFGDLTFSDPVGSIVSNGASFGADAAGPGYTYDLYGDVIPNGEASAIQAQQAADATAANLQNGLTSTGGLTEQQYAAAEAARNSGMSALDAAKKALGNNATQSMIKNLVGALATGAGSLAQANAAKNNGAALSAASREAAGVLAPAITNAAGIQSTAAKNAGATLADAATKGAATQAAGATGAARTVADAATAGNFLQSTAARDAGAGLSKGYLDSAAQRAAGYTAAAGQEVAGYRNAEDIARQTLATQTENQRPYMEAGTEALKTLSEGLKPGGQYNRPFTMADAQNSEAYKFALGQGTEAINNASAAGGLQLSSANIQSLGKFAEGTAAQYEQQAFNQWMAQNNLSLGALQSMVNTGQISTNQLQSALAQAGISMETFESNIGRAQAAGTLGAANATAAGTMGSADALAAAGQQSANYLSNGMQTSANALANGQEKAANYTAGGITGAANATAAGDVSSAGYLASGITGAAGATANGITGGANSIAAGNIGAANALSNGASAIGNQIAKSGVFSNIPTNPSGTMDYTGGPSYQYNLAQKVLGSTDTGSINTGSKPSSVGSYTLADVPSGLDPWGNPISQTGP